LNGGKCKKKKLSGQLQCVRVEENRSDINVYGATNQAEFFAVVSEYFFERPQLLKEKHPELYGLLEKIFCRSLS